VALDNQSISLRRHYPYQVQTVGPTAKRQESFSAWFVQAPARYSVVHSPAKTILSATWFLPGTGFLVVSVVIISPKSTQRPQVFLILDYNSLAEFCQIVGFTGVRSDLGANSSRKGKLPGFIPAMAEIFGTQGQHILSTRA
jgi:hypothetical protein